MRSHVECQAPLLRLLMRCLLRGCSVDARRSERVERVTGRALAGVSHATVPRRPAPQRESEHAARQRASMAAALRR